jgi:hypothetical protein
MALTRVYDRIETDKGAAVAGGRARFIDGSGNIIPVFSDDAGTGIADNTVIAGDDGFFECFIEAADDQTLQILDSSGSLRRSIVSFNAGQNRASHWGAQPQSTVTGLVDDLTSIDTALAERPTNTAVTAADNARTRKAASRAAITALDPAVDKAVVLDAQGDRSLFTLDTRIPAGETGATNLRTQGYDNPGRKKRYIAPGTGTGRFVSEDGVTHVGLYGISPWNTAGQNDAAWNVLRDEITDMQTRQENRPLILQFDNYRYDMSAQWQVWNSHIRLDGRGAEMVGGGFAFTNNGSVNQQLYCSMRDMVVRGAPGQTIPVLRTLISSYLEVSDVTLWGTAGQHGALIGPGNTCMFNRLKVYGAGLFNVLLQAENAPHPGGGVAGRGQPIDMTFLDLDAQGGGGGVGIYECQTIRFLGGAIQNGSGAYGRGMSIETGYGILVDGMHFERNGADVYIQPVDRLGTSVWGAPLPHGSITLNGLAIGGEGIGGAPSPASLLVAGDTPNLEVNGGFYAGAVNINTAGTTGHIFCENMPIYSQHASSPLVRLRGRGAAVADPASATYAAPSGGATVDTEARAALAQLAADVAAMRTPNNDTRARLRSLGLIAP